MAALNAERQKTETARKENQSRSSGISKALEERKRKLDDRRAMIEAKRIKVLGKEEVERLKREKKEKEAEAFLNGLDEELQSGAGGRGAPS
jgi:large subunit ribosomal protein L24e